MKKIILILLIVFLGHLPSSIWNDMSKKQRTDLMIYLAQQKMSNRCHKASIHAIPNGRIVEIYAKCVGRQA